MIAAPIQHALLIFVRYWKLWLFLALVAALALQTHRLDRAELRIKVFEEREAAQRRDQQRRELQNLRNKERTDEEHSAARDRAAVVVVRAKPRAARIVDKPIAAPEVGDGAASCVDGGQLLVAIAEVSRRHAERADAIVEQFAQRNAIRLSALAQVGEALAADLRSCRAFARGVQSKAPGAEEVERVGGAPASEAPGALVYGQE